MTVRDRGPEGQSLGHSHREHRQDPNRAYARYYLPHLYQPNYRLRSVAELDALPTNAVVVGIMPDWDTWAFTHLDPLWLITGSEIPLDSGEVLGIRDGEVRLFVVYRPDAMPGRPEAAT